MLGCRRRFGWFVLRTRLVPDLRRRRRLVGLGLRLQSRIRRLVVCWRRRWFGELVLVGYLKRKITPMGFRDWREDVSREMSSSNWMFCTPSDSMRKVKTLVVRLC